MNVSLLLNGKSLESKTVKLTRRRARHGRVLPARRRLWNESRRSPYRFA